MRQSKLLSKKHKEKPADAILASHVYLLRGGYIRPVANGIYSMLMPAKRIQKKVEAIIREEMDKLDGQEVLMPVVMPRELWVEAGRWDSVGSELLRFKDRTGHDMLLGMTHEEACTALARTEISSYKDFPFMLYQIQTKYRDEARSRGGLMRVREFTMKDAYSFHTSKSDLDDFYLKMKEAYHRIFKRTGLDMVKAICADSGMMGGKETHEFHLLSDAGEDKIVVCDKCQKYFNSEIAEAKYFYSKESEKPLEEIATPNTKTIDDLVKLTGVSAIKMAKMVFYTTEKGETIAVMIRGDIEVNETKLGKILGGLFSFSTDSEVRQVGAVPGFATGMGLTCRVLVDKSLVDNFNLICGANKEGFHLKNFNLSRDLPNAEIVDIATIQDGDICPICGEKLRIARGVEVGHIFKLGKKYTEGMRMTYTDKNGVEQTPIMGCYGIGIGRLIASSIEEHHDDFGPIWPLSIAPWQVQLNAMGMTKEGIKETAEKIYEELMKAGVEVLYDDRDLSAGVQFAEADLSGIPLRLIVAPKALSQGMIEYKIRGTDERGLIPIAEIVPFAQKWISDEMKKYF